MESECRDTKVIIIANNKGGVGKTSSVAAIGDVLARNMHKKVLLIDADPQGNLSRRFGYGVSAKDIDTTLEVYLRSVSEAMEQNTEPLAAELFFNPATQKRPSSKVVKNYDSLNIVCSTPELESMYAHFQSHNEGNIIRRFLFDLKSSGTFDYILIDTSPSLSSSLGQYLLGSDYLMVPVPPSEDAVDGAQRVMNAFRFAERDKKDLAKYQKITFLGFFFCNIAERGRAAKSYRDRYGNAGDFFDTSIPKSAAVLNAENEGAPVTALFPQSPASWGYVKLTREMENRIAKLEGRDA